MLSTRVASLALWLSLVSLVPALAADNTPLNVKPGLWQMTSDTERNGTPPIPPETLAKMSPEQRAKLEAAMKGAMAPQHREDKHCVSQADIDRGFEKLDKMPGQCSQKVTSATATTREGSFQCAGANTSSGTYSFQASSPEAVAATWNMTMTNGGNTMTMKSNMKGKWLGADCGDTAH
jgi:hypothetical protein